MIRNSNEEGNNFLAIDILEDSRERLSVLRFRWDEKNLLARLFSTTTDDMNIDYDMLSKDDDPRKFLVIYNSELKGIYPRVLVAKYILDDKNDIILIDTEKADFDIVPFVKYNYLRIQDQTTITLKPKDVCDKETAQLFTQLGYACEKGTFLQQDYETALKLYEIAGEAGDTQAISNYAWMFHNGFGVDKNIPIAIEIYEIAAKAGNSTAMINLGNIYEDGELGEPDYKKCFEWYKKAAETGDKKGMFNYANCYHNGYGTRKNYKKAFPIFKQLADNGYEGAGFYVGLYYQEGLGMAKDYEQARRYYRLGVLEDDMYCFNQLGVMYAKGLGVKKDIHAAMDYYLEAAKRGDVLAYTNLGWLYEHGDVGKVDLEMAEKFYSMAADAGEENALEALERLEINRVPDDWLKTMNENNIIGQSSEGDESHENV